MEFKTCTKCGQTFPATSEFFHRDSARRDGMEPWCKACHATYSRAYYEVHKKRKLAQAHVYREAHKVEISVYARAWQQRNRERLAEHEWNHRQTDPMYRLSHSISGAMWGALHSEKAGRRWEDLVGYTLDDLIRHLEARFQPGMTWDNYGKWHIDHAIPQSAFSYSSPEDPDFKRCWALSNLEPLWARDNLSKGARESALLATDQRARSRRAG